MLRIVVGDTTPYLQDYTVSIDKNCCLLDNNNIKYIIRSGTFFTSLGDLDEISFLNILSKADEVIYHPPTEWTNTEIHKHTEIILNVVNSRYGNVKNFKLSYLSSDKVDLTLINSSRITEKPQLWFAGCSITKGMGVNRMETYAERLSRRLRRPFTNLAMNASSNRFHATQILKADIKKDDIVVWGLTSLNRIPLFTDKLELKLSDQQKYITHITPKSFTQFKNLRDIVNIEQLDEESMIFETVLAVQQVVNFCKKVGAELYMAGLFNDERHSHYLTKYENYTQLYTTIEGFKDFGDDGEHPGPKTHLWFTDMIEQLINRLKS